MSTALKILQILENSKEVRLQDLVERTGASRQMVHRAVKTLLDKELVQKVGSAPRTFYSLKETKDRIIPFASDQHLKFLNEHFLLITETGTRLTGIEALAYWCNQRNLPVEKTITEFITTREKYLSYVQASGLIDGMPKILSTKGLQQIGLDKLFYLDFYAIERFGKTRLGALLHFAKQGQNQKLMDEIVSLSHERISKLILTEHLEAVGYIPPTIKREIQLMKVLERKFNFSLPHIGLTKVSGEVVVPQKALSKIEDRVNNARFSIMVTEKRKFSKVLLIDDAVGSGATLNETASKLKERQVANEVVGLAITGSFKGFEVLQEV